MAPPGRRECIVCDREFFQYTHAEEAKRCPTCSDLLQNRPTTCVSRSVIARFRNVEIHGLPMPWTFVDKYRKQDFPHYKMEIIGRCLVGAVTGEQRIVVRSASPFPHQGVVDVRIMKVTHIGPPAKRAKKGTKKNSPRVYRRIYIALDQQSTKGAPAESQMIYNVYYGGKSQVIDKSLWSAVTTGQGIRDIAAIVAIVDNDHPIAMDDGHSIASFP